MQAWPVINQLCFPERHFSANGISFRLSEVQMKFCERLAFENIRFSSLFAAGMFSQASERSLRALLSSAPRGFAARLRVLARLASLAQIGELARRLRFGKIFLFVFCYGKLI